MPFSTFTLQPALRLPVEQFMQKDLSCYIIQHKSINRPYCESTNMKNLVIMKIGCGIG